MNFIIGKKYIPNVANVESVTLELQKWLRSAKATILITKFVKVSPRVSELQTQTLVSKLGWSQFTKRNQ